MDVQSGDRRVSLTFEGSGDVALCLQLALRAKFFDDETATGLLSPPINEILRAAMAALEADRGTAAEHYSEWVVTHHLPRVRHRITSLPEYQRADHEGRRQLMATALYPHVPAEA
ncbi:hypothetical protein [Brevundimonas sp.]|jgi:hypothetical protein|uniref:hypothetical protein n=1 Tax=Brevundimonas sp. TaxID=1871086 RepID=UPI002E122ED0|nr:hypothetical protein [Brevundimonas sp.]